MFHYWGFGLYISSEIEFPELLPVENTTADIAIIIDKIPAVEGESTQVPGFIYLFTETEFVFTVHTVATYYAGYGCRINIQPLQDIAVDDVVAMRPVRLYVLATVMAAILLQRKLVPLHASAIIRDDKLVLIAGDSGAGKSTTLAGLRKKGYAIFSDDIVVLKKDSSHPVTVHASYPMIKLWEDTLVKLDHGLFNDRSFNIRSGVDKYGIFFHQAFNTVAYPPKYIIILKIKGTPGITVRRLMDAGAFSELTNQVYRPFLLNNERVMSLTFHLLVELTKNCVVYEVIRPQDCDPAYLLLKIEELL